MVLPDTSATMVPVGTATNVLQQMSCPCSIEREAFAADVCISPHGGGRHPHAALSPTATYLGI